VASFESSEYRKRVAPIFVPDTGEGEGEDPVRGESEPDGLLPKNLYILLIFYFFIPSNAKIKNTSS
jgi:hypothetical protein